MIMADIFLWVFLILGLLLTINAVWLASASLFPSLSASAPEHYGKPLKLTLVGLAVALPLFLIGLALGNANPPLLKVVGVLIVGAVILTGLAGSAGLATRIGNGLPSPIDSDQPWKATLRGGIILSLTFILPFIGWFGILVWTLLTGVGAVALNYKKAPKTVDQSVKSDDEIPPLATAPETAQAE